MGWASLVEISFDFHSQTLHPVKIVVRWLFKSDIHEWLSLGYTDVTIKASSWSFSVSSSFAIEVHDAHSVMFLLRHLHSVLKPRDRSKWANWLWSASDIFSWAIAADTNSKFLRITPQASSEYFWRCCQWSLSFLLTLYMSNLDLSICFNCHTLRIFMLIRLN